MKYQPEEWLKEAKLLQSAYSPEQLPANEYPEVVFCGRSNCGKSTLINTLLGSKKLARVSSTPGRTNALHFFSVRLRDDSMLYYVDCPGFGYASVSKKEQRKWEALMQTYFQAGRQVACFLLVDVRRKLQEEEQLFLDYVEEHPCSIILTKADKVSKNECSKKRKEVKQLTNRNVLPVSSKDKAGLVEVWNEIHAWNRS